MPEPWHDYALIHVLNIGVHILFGGAALLLGGVALASAKGGFTHRRVGRWFVYTISVVLATLSKVRVPQDVCAAGLTRK